MLRRLLLAGATVALAAGLAVPASAQEPDSAAAVTPSAPPSAGGLDPRNFPVAAPPPGSSITNPAISVIGWFQAVAGNDATSQEHAFELREAEMAFQAAVDPFTRADFFVAAGVHGVELEEGTITWLALPGGGQAKLGKFRADLGRFNRTHPPETPFADRPLAAETFLGEEGLVTTGVAASILIPNPFDLYWDVVGNAGTVPEGHEDDELHPVFEADRRSDVMTLGRSSVFVPLGQSADLAVGASYANALARAETRDAEGNRAQLATGDVTLRWKNPRRSIYRSLAVVAEMTALQGTRDGPERYLGWFGYALWQFARQWKVGARCDWTEAPGVHEHRTGALALVQYQPSEFSTLSVQARRVRDPGGDVEHDALFFKWIFNIGPHGAHPY